MNAAGRESSGKPDAGNLHIRFDEGEGFIRKDAPSLLYNMTASRDQLDLRDQAAVNYWFKVNRPEYVFLVAGTVGWIWADATRPVGSIKDYHG